MIERWARPGPFGAFWPVGAQPGRVPVPNRLQTWHRSWRRRSGSMAKSIEERRAIVSPGWSTIRDCATFGLPKDLDGVRAA